MELIWKCIATFHSCILVKMLDRLEVPWPVDFIQKLTWNCVMLENFEKINQFKLLSV